MRQKFDWLLEAAFIAAPIYWGLLYLVSVGAGDGAGPILTTRRVLLLVLAYPVLEEIVFRGAVQGWLRRRSWGLRNKLGLTVANALTSMAFAVAHVLQRSNI